MYQGYTRNIPTTLRRYDVEISRRLLSSSVCCGIGFLIRIIAAIAAFILRHTSRHSEGHKLRCPEMLESIWMSTCKHKTHHANNHQRNWHIAEHHRSSRENLKANLPVPILRSRWRSTSTWPLKHVSPPSKMFKSKWGRSWDVRVCTIFRSLDNIVSLRTFWFHCNSSKCNLHPSNFPATTNVTYQHYNEYHTTQETQTTTANHTRNDSNSINICFRCIKSQACLSEPAESMEIWKSPHGLISCIGLRGNGLIAAMALCENFNFQFLMHFASISHQKKWKKCRVLRTCPGLEDVERLFTLDGLVQQIHLWTTHLTQSWHEAVEPMSFLYLFITSLLTSYSFTFDVASWVICSSSSTRSNSSTTLAERSQRRKESLIEPKRKKCVKLSKFP